MYTIQSQKVSLSTVGRDKGKPKGWSLNWGSMAGADLRDALGRIGPSSIV
jgi:hypothetical protein